MSGPCLTAAKQPAGFTLVETLVTLILSLILALQVGPPFDSLIQSMRIRGATSTLERTLRLARQQAILQQTPTRICPSDDGSYCSPDSDWSKGWIVFVDRVGGRQRDPEDSLIFVQQPLSKINFHYNRGSMISTNSSGRLSQNGTMRICGESGADNNVELVMVHSGRLRLQGTTTGC